MRKRCRKCSSSAKDDTQKPLPPLLTAAIPSPKVTPDYPSRFPACAGPVLISHDDVGAAASAAAAAAADDDDDTVL